MREAPLTIDSIAEQLDAVTTTTEKVRCRLCEREFYRITNTHLWRSHRLTTDEYQERFPDAQMITSELAQRIGALTRGKTYEEIHGAEKAQQLKDGRREAADRQFTDPEQRAIRSIHGTGRECSDDTRLLQRELKTEHGGYNYRERALAHYGEQCQRCGAEPEDLSDLMVHHVNHLHADQAGDHSLENLRVLCRPCHLKEHRGVDGRLRGLHRFEKGILYVLEGMRRDFGIDMTDDNFRDTPKRFARALSEILAGAVDTEKQVEEILSTGFDGSAFDEILFADGIQATSLCPHHLLPVQYEVVVAYLPGAGKVLGLSKLARLAMVLAARPVLQERMTVDITRALMDKAGAKGAAALVRGRHACMWARGIKQDAVVTTSSMLGAFRDKPEARAEVMALINRPR